MAWLTSLALFLDRQGDPSNTYGALILGFNFFARSTPWESKKYRTDLGIKPYVDTILLRIVIKRKGRGPRISNSVKMRDSSSVGKFVSRARQLHILLSFPIFCSSLLVCWFYIFSLSLCLYVFSSTSPLSHISMSLCLSLQFCALFLLIAFL